jgi:Flp pilus assembly pilin Flp
MSSWLKLKASESGAALVEYVLVIALIALGLMLALQLFRFQVGGFFTSISKQIDSVGTPSDGGSHKPGKGCGQGIGGGHDAGGCAVGQTK